MPEILTSVPNGCRWHKDVLAALEVHHGNPPLRGCTVCCSRCRPVPSAACNAVKASQAWRWLQNQKAPCTLDEGKTATRLGTEELLYFFRGSGLLYIFAGFPTWG